MFDQLRVFDAEYERYSEYGGLFSDFPDNLLSVNAVLHLVSILDSSKMCIGNSDRALKELAADHKGVFKNRSGKHVYNSDCLILQYTLFCRKCNCKERR